MISDQIELIATRLKGNLPGRSAQKLMAPTVRPIGNNWPDPESAQPSGVMILLFPSNGHLSTVLIRRTNLGPHARQISLPGGKRDHSDASILTTALRETEEEIGVSASDIKYLGRLTPLFVPHSNFCINPMVGVLNYTPDFEPNASEVEEVIVVDLDSLFSNNALAIKDMSRDGRKIIAPYFDVHGHIVWGATAMIISEFKELMR